jgi:hypothetical protein
MKSATWIVVILALWVGWPSTGCLCANGGFKFFCEAHRTNAQSQLVTEASVEHGDCCQHRSPIERHAPTSDGLSSKGCTPIANIPVIAPVSVAKAVDSHHDAVAFLTLPVATIANPASQLAFLSADHHTGPPVDIVTELHRLLI